MKRTIKKIMQNILGNIRKGKLHNRDFTIISDNCWGGFVYQNYNLSYKSPFVGLFIFSPDYLELLEDLEEYLKKKIIFISPTRSKYQEVLLEDNTFGKYPIGLLGGEVEIHFLHYKDEKEALQKWEYRIKRINYDNLIIKFADRDLSSYELIERFDKLPFSNKICFTAKDYPEFKSVVHLKKFTGEKMVENEWKYYKRYMNITNYLNGHNN
ncbi:DUF1919 domain-containing protein [Bacillus niameyensis]|uniref:DUF1919 domain-containing protein n=1 Tax=Bacillus niameyensis TaxID=1522308 RepID=UPI0007834D69|nr:DUF1919 domain-containing protein [Bacillus niameyensis]